MQHVDPRPPVRQDPPAHTFEPPGDGLPTCMFPGCGRPRSSLVHRQELIRTRVVLVVDHNPAFTPEMLEMLLAQAFASMPSITLQQMNTIL